MDQFVTRFLLKETANQIQSLLSSVESAVEAIEEQTSHIRCVTGTSQGHLGMCHAHTHSHGNLLLAGAVRVLGDWVTLGKVSPELCIRAGPCGSEAPAVDGRSSGSWRLAISFSVVVPVMIKTVFTCCRSDRPLHNCRCSPG